MATRSTRRGRHRPDGSPKKLAGKPAPTAGVGVSASGRRGVVSQGVAFRLFPGCRCARPRLQNWPPQASCALTVGEALATRSTRRGRHRPGRSPEKLAGQRNAAQPAPTRFMRQRGSCGRGECFLIVAALWVGAPFAPRCLVLWCRPGISPGVAALDPGYELRPEPADIAGHRTANRCRGDVPRRCVGG